MSTMFGERGRSCEDVEMLAAVTVHVGLLAQCRSCSLCISLKCVCASSGLVLVTDAIAAMGLPPGRHTLGQQVIEIEGLHAYVAGLTEFVIK